MTDGTPISFAAATRGTPVLSSTGTKIGTLEHVLDVAELDIFEGIVVATHHGLRFIDAEHLPEFTTTHIQSSLSDEQAAGLPPPDGPPVYTVDALEDAGHSLHDVVRRIFGKPFSGRPTAQGRELPRTAGACQQPYQVKCLPLTRAAGTPGNASGPSAAVNRYGSSGKTTSSAPLPRSSSSSMRGYRSAWPA
jgi:hypothetical protein